MVCTKRNKICKSDDCKVCYEKSFASHFRSKNWHHTLNKNIRPCDVFLVGRGDFWFKCDECSHDFQKKLSAIVNMKTWCPFCSNLKLCANDDCRACYEKSFASHHRSVHWNDKLNAKKARELFECSHSVKVWFTCNVCSHDFNLFPADVSKQQNSQWCPYCASKKLCANQECKECYAKSFASNSRSKNWHPTLNGKITPRNVFKFSMIKRWFICEVCSHELFRTPAGNSKEGKWCLYCSGHKLCSDKECRICLERSFASHPKSEYWNQTLNKKTPREVTKSSNNKCWFTCEVCENVFETFVKTVYAGSWCPKCFNKTELKLYNFLLEHFQDVNREVHFSWCVYPKTGKYARFDFFLPSFKIVIELDGDQHFRQVWNWTSPEKQLENDLFKTQKCLENGLVIIRLCQIDVMRDKNDWQDKLMNTIRHHDSPCFIALHETKYDKLCAQINQM
jgi:hypothetical protein